MTVFVRGPDGESIPPGRVKRVLEWNPLTTAGTLPYWLTQLTGTGTASVATGTYTMQPPASSGTFGQIEAQPSIRMANIQQVRWDVEGLSINGGPIDAYALPYLQLYSTSAAAGAYFTWDGTDEVIYSRGSPNVLLGLVPYDWSGTTHYGGLPMRQSRNLSMLWRNYTGDVALCADDQLIGEWSHANLIDTSTNLLYANVGCKSIADRIDAGNRATCRFEQVRLTVWSN